LVHRFQEISGAHNCWNWISSFTFRFIAREMKLLRKMTLLFLQLWWNYGSFEIRSGSSAFHWSFQLFSIHHLVFQVFSRKYSWVMILWDSIRFQKSKFCLHFDRKWKRLKLKLFIKSELGLKERGYKYLTQWKKIFL
jgi:hypothetical protein